MKVFQKYIDRIVKSALLEDIGRADITTEALFPCDRKVKAVLVAKDDMVFAGKRVFESVFRKFKGKMSFRWLVRDGDRIKKGSLLCRMSGSLKNILRGERVALNFVQRMSGIATKTSKFVGFVKSSRTKVLDTRKTTPLLRRLEKYAVKTGGGKNHRMGLFDSFLIKDNHLEVIGSLKKAVSLARKYKHMPIEVETRDLREVREAVSAKADIIMLDNMSPKLVKKALKMIPGKIRVEVSGGVDLNNIADYARLGVDFISIGALTHSAPSVDISLEVLKE